MTINSLKSWQINTGGVTSLALLALVAYALAVRPTFAARETAAAQSQELDRSVGRERELERNLRAVREKVDRAQRELEYAQDILLQSVRDLNRRLAEVEDAATRAGVQINTVQPAAPKNEGRHRIVRISMSGHGGFGHVVSFLNLMHENIQHVVLVGFELTGAGGSGAAAVPLAFTIELDWYAAPAEPIAPGTMSNVK